jgi:hypothetical protein
MKVVATDLAPVTIAVAGAAPFLICVAGSWFATPNALERWFTLTSPKSSPKASRWGHTLGASLALWALTCGAVVIVAHYVTTYLGLRIGVYRTGIAIVVLFTLAAVIAMNHRIAKILTELWGFVGLHNGARQRLSIRDSSHSLKTSWPIKAKTWQKIHIAMAVGAILPLWWHCELKRASTADILLRSVATMLLTSGFLGVATTDLSRWRVLSPKFSPRLSARMIDIFFSIHRGLAVIAFTLIAIHVLVVLYFAGM